jgi:outer membrane protein assembly factor BamA
MRRVLIIATTLMGLVSAAWASPRLDYQGPLFARRQAEAWFTPVLRASGDSAAVSAALARMVSGLQNAGYLDARATAQWDTVQGDRHLVLRIVEGRRQRIEALAVDTPTPADSLALARALGIGIGDWASPAALAEGLKRAVESAAAAGHPYAQIAVTQFAWSDSGARVRVGGSLGPPVTLSGVRFEGMHATEPRFAERALGRIAGQRFDPTLAENGRERLARLGVFQNVEYLGLDGEADWARARLVYRVEEPRYNRFEGALGTQGDHRAAGMVRLGLDNLAGTGRAIDLAWQSRGPSSDQLDAHYAEPMIFGTPLRGEVDLNQQREDSLFTRERWAARVSFLLSGRERIEGGYEQDHVLDRAAGVAEADLQSTLFSMDRDAREGGPVPRRGTRVRIGAMQSFKSEALIPTGVRKSNSSAVDALVDWHQPLGRHAGLAWQLSGAARFGTQPVLGVYERYPLGGAATLRGFDEQAFRVDRYGLSRLEWRWFTGTRAQHLALFWDHAETFTRLATADGTPVELARHDGFGMGLRVDSPAGLVSVDYGLEAGRPPVEGKLHLQLVTQF